MNCIDSTFYNIVIAKGSLKVLHKGPENVNTALYI